MKVFRQTEDLQKFIRESGKAGKVGFVPTMGALHAGHESLIKKSVEENSITVVSIFVNPLQFNNPEDYKKYPISIDLDIKLSENAGADVVFLPNNDEIYKNRKITEFDLGGLDQEMEGKFRPGHFQGVANVVFILFDIVKPSKAYFGEKDFQQLAIIKYMSKTLQLSVEIVACPTVRSTQSLALSSRNARLTSEALKKAALVSQFLLKITSHPKGTKTASIRSQLQTLMNELQMDLEYFEVVESDTLKPVSELEQNSDLHACVAYFNSGVRLIDNVSI